MPTETEPATVETCQHDWRYTHSLNAGRYTYHRHCPLCRTVEKMY